MTTLYKQRTDQRESANSIPTSNKTILNSQVLIFVVVFSALANLIIHGVRVISSTDDIGLLRWLHDDTFYYIMLAKNFVEQGIWSCDGGQTITTGFHLLWAYLLLPLVYLAGNDNLLMMKLAATLSFVVAIIVPIATLIYFVKKKLFLHLLLLAVFISSFSFIVNSLSAMEWPIAFLISALYFVLLANADNRKLVLVGTGIFLLGILGSLSRLEFGALAFAFFLSAILLYGFAREGKYVLLSMIGLVGAIVGVAIVLLHNFHFSGEWLQNSSQIKLLWSTAVERSPVKIIFQSVRTVFFIPSVGLEFKTYLNAVSYLNYVLFFGIVTLVTIGFIKLNVLKSLFLSLKSYMKTHLKEWFLVMSSLLAIMAYFFVYSFSYATFIWYTAFLTVPIFIVFSSVLNVIIHHAMRRIYYVITSLLVIITACNLLVFYTFDHIEDVDLLVETKKTIGLLLKQELEGERIGISDSGIINFYHGRIINLDGLVNNEIKSYLSTHQLECYLLDKKIKYASGFGTSELILNEKTGTKIDWAAFSKLKVFRRHNDALLNLEDATLAKQFETEINYASFPRSNNEIPLILHEIDFVKLAKLPQCLKSDRFKLQ